MGDSGWLKRRMIRWMEDNRGLILTVLGLPLSFLFDLVMQLRNWSYRVFLASPARHQERVRAIQSQVRGGNPSQGLSSVNSRLHCLE